VHPAGRHSHKPREFPSNAENGLTATDENELTSSGKSNEASTTPRVSNDDEERRKKKMEGEDGKNDARRRIIKRKKRYKPEIWLIEKGTNLKKERSGRQRGKRSGLTGHVTKSFFLVLLSLPPSFLDLPFPKMDSGSSGSGNGNENENGSSGSENGTAGWQGQHVNQLLGKN